MRPMLLYRPKMMALDCASHIPHKTMEPKQKKTELKKKNTFPGGNLWIQHFSQDFWFCCFFILFVFVFSRVFVFYCLESFVLRLGVAVRNLH